MYPSVDKIKAILLNEDYISEIDSQAAEAVAGTNDSAAYVEHLIQLEVLSRPQMGRAVAKAYGVPFVNLETNPVSEDQLAVVPEDIARANRVLFIKASGQVAVLASDSPADVKVNQLAPLFDGKKIGIAYALPEQIEAGLRLYEKPLEELSEELPEALADALETLDTRFSQIIASGTRVAPEIIDEIIGDAIQFRASDIHFEPGLDVVAIRFRVDGSLRDAGQIPKVYYENVLNRIKVESGMRIGEHNGAQDGALQRIGHDMTIDLRVSLVPTVQGEKIVMRVLNSYVQDISLADVGFDESQRMIVEACARKPFGMILAVGPTGSGKTTTLYSLISMLNRPDVNITTIEDPVEYKVPRINQIQVREQSGLTFAYGLRSAVRQDPDVILVGEIRDQETAEISVNAALAGHLLLSTLHANDAAAAIARLINAGIEPFMVASTLEMVIAQRLVRRICGQCRYNVPAGKAFSGVNPKITAAYFAKKDTIYAGKGCDACNGTGYQGRTAIFEAVEITSEMKELILQAPSSREIADLARKQGNRSMFEDGILKVKSGVTTLSEVMRVAEADFPQAGKKPEKKIDKKPAKKKAT